MVAVDPTFDAYMRFLLPAEGRFADDKADRGGVTHYGLSKRFLDSIGWEGDPPSREEAIELYRTHFWLGYHCNEMAPIAAWATADAAIQHPPKSAALMLQQALGVNPDGIIGPITIEAAKTPSTRTFWRNYVTARSRYYNDIVASDGTQAVFITGWQLRLHKLAEAMFDAGLFGPAPARPSILKSENAKVAASGVGLFGLVALILNAVGVNVDSIPELLTDVGFPSGLVAIVGGWLAKTRFREGR